MAQPAGEKLGFGYFAGLLGGVACVLSVEESMLRC